MGTQNDELGTVTSTVEPTATCAGYCGFCAVMSLGGLVAMQDHDQTRSLDFLQRISHQQIYNLLEPVRFLGVTQRSTAAPVKTDSRVWRLLEYYPARHIRISLGVTCRRSNACRCIVWASSKEWRVTAGTAPSPRPPSRLLNLGFRLGARIWCLRDDVVRILRFALDCPHVAGIQS